ATPTSSIQVSYMFQICSKLEKLHLESAVLKDVLAGQSINMFTDTPLSLNVVVGSDDMRLWVEERVLVLSGQTVFVDDPPDDRPQPATPTGRMVKVTDTIPAGLTIIEASITGTESPGPIRNEITWSRNLQTITWLVPVNMLPADLTVIVAVNSGQMEGDRFENRGMVNDIEPTNTTYHIYTGSYRVTEQYLLYDGLANDIELDDSLETLVAAGGGYFAAGLDPDIIKAYMLVFCGYEREGLDPGFISDTSLPSPAYGPGTDNHRDDFDTVNNEIIKLYYKQVTVTIHYVDESGSPIKPADTVAMVPGKDYYLPAWYLDSFAAGGNQWINYDYAKNPDDSVRNTDPAGAGAPPAVGTNPLYPDNTVPAFSFGIDPMKDDKNITLYFTNKPAVVVRFVELHNDTHILHSNETYFFTPISVFNPDTVVRSDSGNLTDDIDLTALSGKIYQYAGKYSTDGITIQVGSPGAQVDPCVLTLYFKTDYTLTEKFHSNHDAHYAIELQPDIPHLLESGDTFTGNPPLTLIYGSLVWYYIGFKTDSDDNPLISGSPTDEIRIKHIFGDIAIIYVYEPEETIIIVNFDGNGGTVLAENAKRIIISPESDLGDNMPPDPTRGGYNFTGWNTKKDGSGTAFTSATEVLEDITVYAQWTLIPGGPGGPGGTITPPTPNYGLKVEKELAKGQPSMVYPGDEVHYVIRVTNTGDTALKGVKVTDVIGGKTYDVATISELAPNEFKEFTFTYTVPADAQPGSIIRNTAAAEHSATGTSYADVFVSMFIGDHIWYIRGYEDNTLRPGSNITRAELAMVFFRLLNPSLKNIVPKAPFTDVKGHEWYGLAINLLAHYEIVTGYTDGSFRPNQPVTRREMAAVVSRFDLLLDTDDNPYNDLNAGDWAYGYILSATKKGWFIGDSSGAFRPGDNITRAEFVTVTNRVLIRHILLSDIPASVHEFSDFKASHWAYTNFMEAVHSHDFEKKADGVNETWTKITGTGLDADYNR
ncbi:MAG: S-layer homology domain-containing protein, partial [Clostridiales bacterium]|nr:S-layer homology domain-containing protein [Clostridiales bacterium]